MNFKKNVLFYVIVPLFFIMVAASFYKFMILNDYQVSYEVDCNPVTESCFVDCADEQCTEEYYFSIIERRAQEIFKLCGHDITDCEAANICPRNLKNCTVTYCDSNNEEDNCDAL